MCIGKSEISQYSETMRLKRSVIHKLSCVRARVINKGIKKVETSH